MSRRWIALLALALVMPASGSRALTVPLFDVDFDHDPLGPPPTATTAFGFDSSPFPRHRISRIIFGTPVGGATAAGLTDPLVFQGVGYDQIALDLRYGLSHPELRGYEIHFDVAITEMSWNPLYAQASFTILLDAPDSNSLSFLGDGTLETYQPSGVFGEEYDSVGNYADNTRYHVEMHYDVRAHTWVATLNGQPLFAKSLRGGDLQSVRFNLAGSEPTDTVYLDNLEVWAEVPEPALAAPGAVGLAYAALRRARERRRPQT